MYQRIVLPAEPVLMHVRIMQEITMMTQLSFLIT